MMAMTKKGSTVLCKKSLTSIWSRLQCDCMGVLHWLKGKGDIVRFRLTSNYLTDAYQDTAPPSVSVYFEQGKTLYAGIANALNILLAALELSRLTQHNSQK